MENFFVGFLSVFQVLGIFLGIPIIIGLIIISFALIFEQIKQNMTGRIKESFDNLICSIDADCPEGYICIDGSCVPQNNMSTSISPTG